SRLREAPRQDAGEPAQVRRHDDPDHRGAGVRAPLHPEDGARRGRDPRHLDGEGVHHRGAAAGGDDLRAALRRRRLLLGEARRARLRRLGPDQHRGRGGRGDEAGGPQDPPDLMPVLATRVDPRSEAYRANHAAMLEQLRYLDEQLALARAGGGDKYVRRHRERGKLLARERIELLLDRDAPFLELSPLAAWG